MFIGEHICIKKIFLYMNIIISHISNDLIDSKMKFIVKNDDIKRNYKNQMKTENKK